MIEDRRRAVQKDNATRCIRARQAKVKARGTQSGRYSTAVLLGTEPSRVAVYARVRVFHGHRQPTLALDGGLARPAALAWLSEPGRPRRAQVGGPTLGAPQRTPSQEPAGLGR